jgi:hypothetical protein
VIARFGESVTLIAAPSDKPDGLQWAATGGTIQNKGGKVIWKLEALPSDQNSQTAFVVSRSKDGTTRSCSVEVWLAEEPLKGTVLETGRVFLRPGRREEQGFGLYSYLVLGSPVNQRNRSLYEAVVAAYLDMVRPLAALQNYFQDKASLAALYVPVKDAPPSSRTTTAEIVKWLVDHYDYERMRAMVDKLPKRLSDGPYLVSSTRPLSEAKPLAIQLNLELVPEDVADLWVKEFLSMTAQEHSWEVQKARVFTLKARTLLAILATNIPDVKHSLEEWLTFGDVLKPR